jgi:hypothetical protein
MPKRAGMWFMQIKRNTNDLGLFLYKSFSTWDILFLILDLRHIHGFVLRQTFIVLTRGGSTGGPWSTLRFGGKIK